MKTITIILLAMLLLSSCSTMQNFKSTDVAQDGIRYKYGSNEGIKIGETVKAYQKSNVGRGFKTEPIGSLTIIKVEPDFSIMKKDGEFNLDESMWFSR